MLNITVSFFLDPETETYGLRVFAPSDNGIPFTGTQVLTKEPIGSILALMSQGCTFNFAEASVIGSEKAVAEYENAKKQMEEQFAARQAEMESAKSNEEVATVQ